MSTAPSRIPGVRYLAQHESGKGKLTVGKAVQAKCADCMNLYGDGRIDCRVPGCPLYPWMPYASGSDASPETP